MKAVIRLGQCLAEKAISLIGNILSRGSGTTRESSGAGRNGIGATTAGLSFSLRLALVHALEYPVGGAVHVSHWRGDGLSCRS